MWAWCVVDVFISRQIIEKSRLLAQVASSLLTKEKKLEAVKDRLRTLKSITTSHNASNHPGSDASDSQALLIRMDEQYGEQANQDDPSSSPVTDEAKHSIKLDVEEIVQTKHKYQALEDWTVSSFSEQDIKDLSHKDMQFPSPHHVVSTQASVSRKTHIDTTNSICSTYRRGNKSYLFHMLTSRQKVSAS